MLKINRCVLAVKIQHGIINYAESAFHCSTASASQWRRQNFSAAEAQPRHRNLDWDTFKKSCVLSLFLVKAFSSYTVRTNGIVHVFIVEKVVFCEKR